MADNISQRREDLSNSSSTSHRRRRLALACVSCRKSKIRCDRRQPCGACIRSRHKTCVYDANTTSAGTSRGSGILADGTTTATSLATPEHTDTDLRGGDLLLGPITPASSSSTTNTSSLAAPSGREKSRSRTSVPSHGPGPDKANAPFFDVDRVLDRLFLLERRLDGSATTQDLSERNARRQQVHEEEKVIDTYLAVDIHEMSRGVVSKTRYFGQSHWMNSVIHFRPLLELFEQQSKDAKSEAVAVLNRCKALARTIKAQRYPGITTKFGTNIPSKAVADKLVDGYLRTLETVFRVLHFPTFMRDYEKFWEAPDAVGVPFTIQLQLVMAIGATLYDETFTMRKSAVQWVTEAQYWLLGPPAKGKLTITGLQIMILLTLARETASVGGDLAWIHVGSLLRSALYMGLHRDPSRLPRMSRLDAEMRRRLWNTIMEIELKSSIDSGGYPMIALDMSDTRAPADVDDVDLMDDDTAVDDGDEDRFTDMTVALLMRDSFRERLAIYQMLNATPFKGTYDDTIRLHRRFMAAFTTLTSKLKGYPSSRRRPTAFQCRSVEVMARRCLMNLHLPYLGPGFREPAFAFSRAQVTEASAKIYYLIFPAAAHDPAGPLLPPEGPSEILSTEGDDLARFALCGAGFWRLLATQPSMVAALELQMVAQEDQGLGPPLFRPDLLNILRHSLPYYLSRIEAGETNVKGYLFITALAGHVQAAMDGRTGQQLLEPILTAAIRTEKLCFEILKRQAGSAGLEDATASEPSDDPFNWDSLITVDGGWGDAAAMGTLFDVASVEAFLGANEGFNFNL